MPKKHDFLRYQLYRSTALKLATATTRQWYEALGADETKEIDLTRVRFDTIDADALIAYQAWAQDSHFSWDEVPAWKSNEPRAFDLSIWYINELCGLCFANPNQSRLRVKIIRLEGQPGKAHPLKSRIGALTMIAVEHYARIIGSRWIEIQEPAAGAIPVYRDLGFSFDTCGRLVIALDRT